MVQLTDGVENLLKCLAWAKEYAHVQERWKVREQKNLTT